MTAPRYARAQPSLTAARPLVRCAVKDGLCGPRPARPVGVHTPPYARRARKACTSGLGRGRPLATCVRDRARDARALPSTPGLRQIAMSPRSGGTASHARPSCYRALPASCAGGSVWERWPICVVQPARARPMCASFASLPFSATLTASPSHFRARRCSPWLRPGGIHGNLQLPWRYRGCPGGTELPPRYTELYEPVGVDYILFTYLSCTRLHDVLLRCSVVAQPRQCTGARGE